MKSIGLDIGTTTICAVLIDTETGAICTSKTLPNSSYIASTKEYEKIQDPLIILSICNDLVATFTESHQDIVSIGLAGQMHGILYLDATGNPVSPFFTWQDERGTLLYKDSLTYATYLCQQTGFHMASGFGLTTHFYNQEQQLIPKDAAVFCNIADYISMTLGQRKIPLLHPSMAASLGLFDLKTNGFSKRALNQASISPDLLPSVATIEAIVGHTVTGIPVALALGDNQASFLGSTSSPSDVLVNVGTGSQISICTNSIQALSNSAIECRPYIGDSYLLAGSSLCGGYAYALLKDFFEETLAMFDCKSLDDFYDTMTQKASLLYHEKALDKLTIDTRLQGTRQSPLVTGSLYNLSSTTFHPAHFALGVLEGICEELYGFFETLPLQTPSKPSLVCSGNGLRMNSLLQQIFSDQFQMPAKIPAYSEEAAYGSALFSLYASGHSSLSRIQQLIKYQ